MAKTIVIDIQADTKSAQNNVEKLTETIEEQNKVLLDFEKELLEVNQKLDSTSKSNLQARKKLIDQRKQLQRGIKEQRLSLKGLNAEKRVSNRENKKLSSGTKEVTGLLYTLTGGLMSGVVAGFKTATGAARLFTFGLKGVAAGLVATGIGAFVVAFGLLATYFTQTQEGADILGKALAKIGTVFNVLIDRASAFGKGLFEIMNFNFDKGLAILKESFKGVGDEIAREVKQTGELEDALVLLEEQEIEFIKTKALKEKQIAESRAAAEDELKTDKERIRLTRLAIALEKELLDEELRIARERARIISAETKQGESKNEELRKEADAIAKVSEVETKRFNRLRTLQADLNSLIGDPEEVARESIERMQTLGNKEVEIKREIAGKIMQTNEEIAASDLVVSQKYAKAQDMKANSALQGLKAVRSLTNAFAKDNEKSQKKAFEINKKLQIAQAIIETYKGANAIFAAAALNPATVLFPAQPFIAAGAAIVSGLANVATIKKQKFQGGSSSSGGGGGGIGSTGGSGGGAGFQASTPTISAIPTFNPNQNNNQNNVRAYVIQNDINNQNALDKRIRQRATL